MIFCGIRNRNAYKIEYAGIQFMAETQSVHPLVFFFNPKFFLALLVAQVQGREIFGQNA